MVYGGPGGGSRLLLRRIRQVMAGPGGGAERLATIVRVIASNMVAEVCSIYLMRDERTLELRATEGLREESVGQARLRVGAGLVGRIAQRAEPISTDDAPNAPGFQFLPEVGEELYRSFLGVPIQRLGRMLGVLVVQNVAQRVYEEDEIEALEVIAMVIAEMAEAGVLAEAAADPAMRGRAHMVQGIAVCDGVAIGPAHLHDPKAPIVNPIVDDVVAERARLRTAMEELREEVDRLLDDDLLKSAGEHRDVLNTYRMFAHDKGWLRRLEAGLEAGVAAEVAVERVQTAARARMERLADPYMRERLHDLDDLANRLLRRLAGRDLAEDIPEGAVLVARTIGPGELLEYQGRIAGLVLEEGSAASHAAIVARAFDIPMVADAGAAASDALTGDLMIVDGDSGVAHLRPDPDLTDSYRQKIDRRAEEREGFRALRDRPAVTRDGARISLQLNAGTLADMPSLAESGAEGIGLFRTELQFLVRASMPGRDAQTALYSRILDEAAGARVAFRTLDIGSDKILPYMKRAEEENPAIGWRAVRFGLDRPLLMRMQMQALLRAAGERPLTVMFPFVSEAAEFAEARKLLYAERDKLQARGRPAPATLEVGAMLEVPSLAYADQSFFELTDFVSVGGNDLMQFFFAADRGNEKVRLRYDPLSPAFLYFLRGVVMRCAEAGAPLSFCGEQAGRPLEALALAAIGFRSLSMRAASIGPVKRLLRAVDLAEAEDVVKRASTLGERSVRPTLRAWLDAQGVEL